MDFSHPIYIQYLIFKTLVSNKYYKYLKQNDLNFELIRDFWRKPQLWQQIEYKKIMLVQKIKDGNPIE